MCSIDSDDDWREYDGRYNHGDDNYDCNDNYYSDNNDDESYYEKKYAKIEEERNNANESLNEMEDDIDECYSIYRKALDCIENLESADNKNYYGYYGYDDYDNNDNDDDNDEKRKRCYEEALKLLDSLDLEDRYYDTEFPSNAGYELQNRYRSNYDKYNDLCRQVSHARSAVIHELNLMKSESKPKPKPKAKPKPKPKAKPSSDVNKIQSQLKRLNVRK